jgi:hypothetical protein
MFLNKFGQMHSAKIETVNKEKALSSSTIF